MTTLSNRYLSLDVFRGMTICLMIIVNSPGSWSFTYGPFDHAKWNGFTPTDLVFPSFLFAVGNAMAFVMQRFGGQPERVFWSKILKRTSIIFLLGFLMYWYPFFQDGHLKPLAETRFFGVLQRIALGYFFAAIILHYGSKNFAIWFSVFALFSYWGLAYLFGEPGDPYSLAGNASRQLDLWLVGEKHLYNGEGIAFDPEGLLSTLPAIVNVIAGFLAGDFIRRKGNAYETIAKLMIAGAAFIALALMWNEAFPINKKLWTSSYVVLTVGLDLIILPVLIFLIEIQRSVSWTNFFVVFGRNPLFIYLLSEILLITLYAIPVGEMSLQEWIYDNLFKSWAAPIDASLLFAIVFMLLCWAVGYLLDRKRIYVKV
jgi:predicted acyltransferase